MQRLRPAAISSDRATDSSLEDMRAIWLEASVLFLVVLMAKTYLATQLDLFGDGAFYWLESKRPALAYSDVPFVTPMLVKLGTAVVGDTRLGVRLLFLIIGSCLPLTVYLLALPIVGRRDALMASIYSLLIPVASTLGVLVVPDVPLLVLSILALAALERATRTGQLRYWILTGFLGALSFSTHYRFALFPVATVLYLVLTANGRSQWRTRGLWLATLIALLGLVPVAYFNLTNQFAGVAFHFYDRHPWTFHPEGLLYLVIQAIWITPLIFAVLVMTLARCIIKGKQGSDRHAMMALFGGTYILVFAALSPWAVGGSSTTGHWALFGYFPLLVYLPSTLRALSGRFRSAVSKHLLWLVPGSGLVGVVLVMAYGTLAAHYADIPPAVRSYVTNKMAGWSNVGAKTDELLRAGEPSTGGRVVADNYYLASQIAFTTRRTDDVYNLDDEKIFRHGRAIQRAIWEIDEPGLRRHHPGKNAVVVVEETKLNRKERAALLIRLCGLFERLYPLDDIGLFDAERRYEFYLGKGIRAEPQNREGHQNITRNASCILTSEASGDTKN